MFLIKSIFLMKTLFTSFLLLLMFLSKAEEPIKAIGPIYFGMEKQEVKQIINKQLKECTLQIDFGSFKPRLIGSSFNPGLTKLEFSYYTEKEDNDIYEEDILPLKHKILKALNLPEAKLVYDNSNQFAISLNNKVLYFKFLRMFENSYTERMEYRCNLVMYTEEYYRKNIKEIKDKSDLEDAKSKL